MGSCLCKDHTSHSVSDRSDSNSLARASTSQTKTTRAMDVIIVDQLIIEMLRVIGRFSAESEDESPIPMVKLNSIADKEEGWGLVASSLINTIPLDDPLGPSAIAIIFDDIPLPPKDAVINLVRSYSLCRQRALTCLLSGRDVRRERNMCVVLGCIAEKFAGACSMAILSQDTMDYLVTFMREQQEARLVLFALIALEKFARTTENKWTIIKYFASQPFHPLLPLEHFPTDNPIWKEVVFCVRWALDNTFLVEGRPLAYEAADTSNINAMLNAREVSDYFKISPDGLEARCDSHNFETVRCTFQADSGCWYYEVEILTPGVMQIGWASKSSTFQNHEGYGVGDDSFSMSYDGCRRYLWHRASPFPVFHLPQWVPGDILGCLLDITRQEVVFTLNGIRLTTNSEMFENTGDYITSEGTFSEAYYAAASFMAHQQCRFNFGHQEFKYPPEDREFCCFNDFGTLTTEDKKIMPRRILMEELKNAPIVEGSCVLCYDNPADCTIEPCLHSGFCGQCASQVRECPICRESVWNVRCSIP